MLLSLKPVWYTQQISEQIGLHYETVVELGAGSLVKKFFKKLFKHKLDDLKKKKFPTTNRHSYCEDKLCLQAFTKNKHKASRKTTAAKPCHLVCNFLNYTLQHRSVQPHRPPECKLTKNEQNLKLSFGIQLQVLQHPHTVRGY